MAKLGAAFRVSQYGLRKLMLSPKLYVVVAFVIMLFTYFLDAMYDFLAHYQVAVNIPGLTAFILSESYFTAMLGIGGIVIFSSAPFYDEVQQDVLLRVGQRTWLVGQMLYILMGTLIYLAMVLGCTAMYLWPHIDFSGEWDAAITTFVYGGDGLTTYGIDLQFPASVLETFAPYQACALSLGLRFLVMVLCTLIIFIVNTAFRTKLGVLAATFVLFLDVLDFPSAVLMRVSPSTLARLSMLDLGYNDYYPSLRYAVMALSAATIACMAIAVAAGRRYDVADRAK